jgi:predicted alpha/beta hydrolase family esterase
MKNAILLHGLPDKKEYYNSNWPSASNSHWFPWLQQELERFPIGPDTILVGHSAGAGFWVRYLSEHPEIFVDKVILVAPWLNLDHEYNSDFYEFEIDPSIAEHAKDFIIFSSDNDGQAMQDSVEYLVEKLPNVSVQTFHEYGHFTQRTLNDNKFPELLEVILA